MAYFLFFYSFGQISLRGASFVLSFRLWRHLLAFFAGAPLSRRLFLHATALTLSGKLEKKKFQFKNVHSSIYAVTSVLHFG